MCHLSSFAKFASFGTAARLRRGLAGLIGACGDHLTHHAPAVRSQPAADSARARRFRPPEFHPPPAPGRTQPFSALVMMTFVPRACDSSSVAQTSSSSAARALRFVFSLARQFALGLGSQSRLAGRMREEKITSGCRELDVPSVHSLPIRQVCCALNPCSPSGPS